MSVYGKGLLLIIGAAVFVPKPVPSNEEPQVFYYPLIRSVSPVSRNQVLAAHNISSLLKAGKVDEWKREAVEVGLPIEKYRHDFRMIVRRNGKDEMLVHFPNIAVIDGTAYTIPAEQYYSMLRDVWGAMPEDLRISALPELQFGQAALDFGERSKER
ncbi:MAG: hypothetical protein LCH41_12325 [Armatimonadetes bacterium]|nr:hypothetical protein [Armatimonadota bacterium]